MDQQQVLALCGMNETVRTLVGLYCGKHPAEMQIADWFAGIEFEQLRPEVSCMAAAIAANNDYAGVPRELVPRLQGIIRYVHTLNSGMTAGLCALGKRFNEAGILMQLIGRTAVHLGYPSPPHRHMWQTDITVLETDFPRAAALAEQAGFTVQKTPYSATVRRGNTQCVLIRKGVELTREAAELTVGGVSFRTPCSEELLVGLTETAFQLISNQRPGAKLIPCLMDLHCVIAAAPDWKAAAAVAAKRGTAAQARLVLEVCRHLMPGILTQDMLDCFCVQAHADRLSETVLAYRETVPGKHRLKRLWFSARLRSADSPPAALGVFLRELLRAGLRKLTPGG